MQRGSYEMHYLRKFLIAHPTSKIGDEHWAAFLAECTKVGISEVNARRFVDSLAPRSATTVTPYKVTAPQPPVVAPKPAPTPVQLPKYVPPTPAFPAYTPRTAPPQSASKPASVPGLVAQQAPKAKASAPNIKSDVKPAPAPATVASPVYDEMTKKELIALAQKRGIEVDAKFSKSKIISLLSK